MVCPNCNTPIVVVDHKAYGDPVDCAFVFPAFSIRPLPAIVRDPYRRDFTEACAVLSISPKASAALSRRILQMILREAGHFTQHDLADQIKALVDSPSTPSYISKAVDAIRNIGNFAAHPIKSKDSGVIAEVDPGEAEWSLDVLESLFDFYFVQPEKLRNKTEELNAKLATLGKPPIKGTSPASS